MRVTLAEFFLLMIEVFPRIVKFPQFKLGVEFSPLNALLSPAKTGERKISPQSFPEKALT
jgi:hypothetical protein